MNKKGQQLTLGTIIGIILGVAALVFLIYLQPMNQNNFDNPKYNYTVYVTNDCNVTLEKSCNMTQTIKVDEMHFDDEIVFDKSELYKYDLDVKCKKLQEDVYGCGKFLVVRE